MQETQEFVQQVLHPSPLSLLLLLLLLLLNDLTSTALQQRALLILETNVA